jgi:hypothetical protein
VKAPVSLPVDISAEMCTKATVCVKRPELPRVAYQNRLGLESSKPSGCMQARTQEALYGGPRLGIETFPAMQPVRRE